MNEHDTRPKILIVDDERFYINVLVELLRDNYRTAVARNGERALALVRAEAPPDLILLDVIMPEMDGYEVCRRLKADPGTAQIPVIFLTIKSEVDDEIRGFQLGAVDYISKPVSPPIVKARVANHLALRRAQEALKKQNRSLERRVAERTAEISRTQDVAIFSLASLAETRDNETGNHIRRTQSYVRILATYLRENPRFRKVLKAQYIELLYKSAPLHDIGKVGVPDSILLKPGKLDAAEWEEMKRHAAYGKEAIERAESTLGSTSFLNIAKEIAWTHHERWDGSGYPRALKGDQIPISGRLMALADVYDALISKRVYKSAYPHTDVVEIIRGERGRHFDPDVVDAFLALQDEFQAIAARYTDRE
jgi:putative two-component system response regulator